MKKILAMVFAALIPAAALSALTVVNSGVTNITATSAWVQVSVTATGAANPYLRFYWGTTDGGTNASSWAFTNDIGVSTGVATYSAQISGLPNSTIHYYRGYATNGTETNWASYTAQFITLSGGTSAPPASVQAVTVDTNDVLKHPGTNFWWTNRTGIANSLSGLFGSTDDVTTALATATYGSNQANTATAIGTYGSNQANTATANAAIATAIGTYGSNQANTATANAAIANAIGTYGSNQADTATANAAIANGIGTYGSNQANLATAYGAYGSNQADIATAIAAWASNTAVYASNHVYISSNTPVTGRALCVNTNGGVTTYYWGVVSDPSITNEIGTSFTNHILNGDAAAQHITTAQKLLVTNYMAWHFSPTNFDVSVVGTNVWIQITNSAPLQDFIAASNKAAAALSTNGGTMGGTIYMGTNGIALGTNIILYGGMLNGTNGIYGYVKNIGSNYWFLFP